MTAGSGWLRRPDAPKQPAFLELLFDLVYVFDLTQITHLLVGHLNWPGAALALVTLLALWWLWVLTAWVTDRFDPQVPAVQGYVIATMLGVLLMGTVVPELATGYGLLFAITYVAIHAGRAILILLAGRGSALSQRAPRASFWLSLSGVPWILGGLQTHGLRLGLWLLATSVDYISAMLRWPTPGLGRAPDWEIAISESHIAERYRQMFIIALGEMVLLMGVTFAMDRVRFTIPRTTVLVLSFTMTAVMWRLYIYRAGGQLAPAIAASPNKHRLTLWSSFAHLLMVAGVILTAAAFTIALMNPARQPPPSWIVSIAGGPAVFLVGRSAFEYLIFSRVSRRRLVAILILVATAPAALLIPPWTETAVPTLVLAILATLDATARSREPSPPL